MPRSGLEFTEVQKPAFELLRDQLGYRYTPAESLGESRSSDSDVILLDILTTKLREINPGITDNGIRDTVEAIRQPLAKNLLEANEACYVYLNRWVSITEFRNGKVANPSIKFFDFENPENNDFLVVDELVVKGPRRTRRLDLVVFVNGIPLVVIECKSPTESDGITKAVADLRDYQAVDDGVARLFHTCLLTLALNKHDARYGTVGTPLERYAKWKSVFPRTKFDLERMFDRELTKQDRLLIGMLSKPTLIDLLRNFVVFDRDDGKLIKKLARYQQFEAVNLTLQRILGQDQKHATVSEARGGYAIASPAHSNPRDLNLHAPSGRVERSEGRAGHDLSTRPAIPETQARENHETHHYKDSGGVIWHTQGSGKSLTMLWLCLKLRRETRLDNPTLLIVTDRTDLDRQITSTFINCNFENPIRAARVDHLRNLLTSGTGRTVMTTIQKFRDEFEHADDDSNNKAEKLFRERLGDKIVDEALKKPPPVLSEDGNIFVLIDEAHRTEYGKFNANLRRALPNACLIGFTGTPIPKTIHYFGSYIHCYKMPQSVKDGATVPILYESRLADLEFDVDVWARFDDLSQKELATRNRRLIKFGEVRSRIESISKDIAEHYRANLELDGFKAMVAVSSQVAASIYHTCLAKLLGPRLVVLISGTKDKSSPLNDLRDQFSPEEQWIEKFKTSSVEETALLIVVDKYLTGFDAPIVRAMYLDKPLTEHNLLQAIARVNRPMPEKGKEWGLIVDYWGIAAHLNEALASLSVDIRPDEAMKQRDSRASVERLKQTRDAALDLFDRDWGRDDIEPWILKLEKEDTRAIFHFRHREFYKALEQLLPDPRALDFVRDFAWIDLIKKEAKEFYQEAEDSLPSAFSKRVEQRINESLQAKGVEVLLSPVNVLDDEFSVELNKLKSDHAKASRMEHKLTKTITLKMHEDPAFYGSLQQRIQDAVEEYREGRIEDTGKLRLLSAVRDTMRDGQSESAETLGLNSESYAVYGLINRQTRDDRLEQEDIVDIADSIYEALRNEAVLDWVNKEDVQREMRRKLKRQLRLARFPKDKIETLTAEIMDWARTTIKV
ncbi:type I restriction endonuclease subunit R [Rhodopirellula sp. P2]|uniref:type I restriction endonuclease subunit R n=1 Tax=Rhodopirellula sp. P2 TaxID=2127060 RepID=UPI002368492E|nr:type I restriction endonuclease subunit R [Rhodopirellula sp. P2]WDQ17455.1 type I restriction endonuclease subunit R [Rhodopirellula sp. P2]